MIFGGEWRFSAQKAKIFQLTENYTHIHALTIALRKGPDHWSCSIYLSKSNGFSYQIYTPKTYSIFSIASNSAGLHLVADLRLFRLLQNYTDQFLEVWFSLVLK